MNTPHHLNQSAVLTFQHSGLTPGVYYLIVVAHNETGNITPNCIRIEIQSPIPSEEEEPPFDLVGFLLSPGGLIIIGCVA